MWRLTAFLFVFFAGCTIPAHVYFRNYSNKKVRLQATLVDRNHFDKVPNKVYFLDTSNEKGRYYGEQRSSSLVTWLDTITFYIDVPAYTVVNIADVSKGLVLGGVQPDVLLILIADNKVDTLTTGDFFSLDKKFQWTGYGVFRDPVFYYDIH